MQQIIIWIYKEKELSVKVKSLLQSVYCSTRINLENYNIIIKLYINIYGKNNDK